MASKDSWLRRICLISLHTPWWQSSTKSFGNHHIPVIWGLFIPQKISISNFTQLFCIWRWKSEVRAFLRSFLLIAQQAWARAEERAFLWFDAEKQMTWIGNSHNRSQRLLTGWFNSSVKFPKISQPGFLRHEQDFTEEKHCWKHTRSDHQIFFFFFTAMSGLIYQSGI